MNEDRPDLSTLSKYILLLFLYFSILLLPFSALSQCGIQSDLQLWLNAETGTNTTIEGADVTSWADQSLNAYSANADVNTIDNPIYSNNELNFNPGITFDGTYTNDFSDGLHLGSDYIYSTCLLYTSPSPRDLSTSRMPSSA